jgi:lipid A 3-O-deacylase
MRLPHLFAAGLLTLTGIQAYGGAEAKTEQTVEVATTPFDQGKFELQSQSGVYFSVGGGNRPTLNYSSTAYRLGVMLNTPSGDGFLRGNCELMLQIFAGSVFDDNPGNYLVGGTIILRYNFVQPDSKWVPYVQIGAGGAYNDIYKDQSQRLIGQNWEFDLEAALGIRYFFNDRWSAALEGGYRHISNADTNERNVGLNSIGATVGLGLHF